MDKRGTESWWQKPKRHVARGAAVSMIFVVPVLSMSTLTSSDLSVIIPWPCQWAEIEEQSICVVHYIHYYYNQSRLVNSFRLSHRSTGHQRRNLYPTTVIVCHSVACE